MSSGPVLCLDGGRSGCRARLYPRAGTPGHPIEAHSRPVPAVRGPGGVSAVLAALDALMAALPDRRADVVVAGLAGLRVGSSHAPALAAALAARTGARRVVATGDLVTGYVGALGMEPGVVVSAGTGAVAFALGSDGRTARAGGWGHLLGDEGSGFWVGRAGLAAALAHHDGRAGTGGEHGSAALAARAEAAFGPLDALPDQLEGDDAVARVAAFAPEVAAAAGAGDPVAAALWAQAGRALAAAAVAAAERALGTGVAAAEQALGTGVATAQPALGAGATAASWTGGLFAAGELLVAPFGAELGRRAPHLRLRPPAGSALDGARRLADVDPIPPALGYVHTA